MLHTNANFKKDIYLNFPKQILFSNQANLVLIAYASSEGSGDSEGPGIWFSALRFLLTHCLYERAAEVLARLRGCSGSPESSLLA